MILNKLNINDNNFFMNESLKIYNNISQIKIDTKYTRVFGLGQRYNSINQAGNVLVNMVEEKFCHQGKKTYYPLPFFILDNGYAFFLHTKYIVEFNFKEVIEITVESEANGELYILKGKYLEIISDFINITGSRLKMPKWCFGPWLSAHRWNTQDLVYDVLDKAQNNDIPFTVMVLEQWSDEATFYIFNGAKYPDKSVISYDDFDFSSSPWSNPKAMIDTLHNKGVRLLLWQCPVLKHIPADEPRNVRHKNDCEFAIANDYVVKSPDGIYTISDGNWFGKSMIPDFTNTDAKKWWFNNRKYLLDIGVDGFKTDGGEFIYGEALNSINENEKELKNNYVLGYVSAYNEFLSNKGIVFSRAGYIGSNSYSAYWAGDQKSNFDELKSVYNAGINTSICGGINWGFDIGGFSGELPELELIYRAHQLAVFSPIMQVHSEPVGGQFSITDPVKKFNNERTPWNLAKGNSELLTDIRNLYNLRMNVLPYIYSEYLKALESNTTLMKPMFLEYDDMYVYEQYLFGGLMVVPILNKVCSNKKVIFPDDSVFYDIFTHKKYQSSFDFEHIKLKDMFVFIKEGDALARREKSIIPNSVNNSLMYTKLEFSLFGAKGRYRFIDDDNDFEIIWNDHVVDIIGNCNIDVNYEIINYLEAI